MTDAERHQRAKAIFLDVVTLPRNERDEALARQCAADAAMRAEVESLLVYADEAATQATDRPSVGVGKPRRFSTGDVFAGRYRIVAEIGRGASGNVYRAVDMRLGVEIALKILHQSSTAAIRHLLEEVRLARQISDPAICRVYDVEEADGVHFLTMELIDGENLSSLLARVGRLSSEKVRTIGIQLSRGLAAAHERGILHRDLKPSNVMLDAGGAVRLTDFGVAALESTAETAPLAGTPAYMAPEQLADGAAASVKTDLYAVGLILYEALVGSAASRGKDQRASEDLPKPSLLVGDVDPGLEAVVLALLARDPNDRPTSAAEVAERLGAGVARAAPARRATATRGARAAFAVSAAAVMILLGYLALGKPWRATEEERTAVEQAADAAGSLGGGSAFAIVVLPIADESDTRDQGHLAEGIQDRIIERLSTIPGLRVIGEESADRFGAGARARAVGRDLDVDFVAAGALHGSGTNARVDLALHDGASGEPVWTKSHRYGEIPTRALIVDREVADEVATRLRLDARATATTTATTLATMSEPDTETYSLYLRGREHVPPFSRREFETSVDLLKQVIARAPTFAPAHAAIATAYVAACALRWVEPIDGYPLARRYAERAVELDGSLAEAHVALALIAGEYDWNWQAAEASYARALALCPGAAWTHRSLARFLATQGRFEESLAATRLALELDPRSALMAQGAAQRFLDARQYERAVALARLAVRLDPINPHSYPTLAMALLEHGEHAEAIAQIEKGMVIAGVDATGQARLAYALARSGDRDAAAAAAEAARRLGSPDSFERALLAMALGDESAAVAALAEAVAARAPPSIWLAVSAALDPLRARDDFRALIAKVGLPLVPLDVATSAR
jgi:TolB-like protein/tetratricopeptide (TPR) repeat protein